MYVKVNSKKIKHKKRKVVLLSTSIILTSLLVVVTVLIIVISLFFVKRKSGNNTKCQTNNTDDLKEYLRITPYKNLDMISIVTYLTYKVKNLDGKVVYKSSRDNKSKNNELTPIFRASKANIEFSTSAYYDREESNVKLFNSIFKRKESEKIKYLSSTKKLLELYLHTFSYNNSSNNENTLTEIREAFSEYIYEILRIENPSDKEKLLIDSIYVRLLDNEDLKAYLTNKK